MTDKQMIEQGVAAILPLYIAEDQASNAFDYVLVKAVLDAVLPSALADAWDEGYRVAYVEHGHEPAIPAFDNPWRPS